MVQHAPNGVQQFTHHRDHGLHRFLAGGDEFVVEGFDVGLVLNGHQGWHVERGAPVTVADFADAPRAMNRGARQQAFEQGAVDYVLKPLSVSRLATAVTRLKQRIGSTPARLDGLIERLAEPREGEYLSWITASQGREVRLITIAEVCYFRSDNKYTAVVTPDGEAVIRMTLRELIDQLDPAVFWQVHRSTVVNANAIAGLVRDGHGRLNVKLKQRSETLLVSETHASRFRVM